MSLLMAIVYITVYVGMISALVILVDIFKNPQLMKIMNIVWVINGLYLGPFSIGAYWVMGRVKGKHFLNGVTITTIQKIIIRCIGISLCGKVFLFPLVIVQEDASLGDAIGVPIVFLTGLTIMGSAFFAHYISGIYPCIYIRCVFSSFLYCSDEQENGKGYGLE